MKPAIWWKNVIKSALTYPKINYFEFSGESFLSWHHLKRAAVLLLFVEKSPDRPPILIFTKRSELVNSHRGQMSFPGGGFDPAEDSDLVACALREAEEEIGILPEQVEVLGDFEEIITTSQYWLTPIVGWMEIVPKYKINPIEVKRVIEIPVDWLFDQKRNILKLQDFYRNGRTFNTFFFPPYDGEVVWGATASILLRLFHRVERFLKEKGL